MTVVFHDDPHSFARLVRPRLALDPDRHTVALTAVAGMTERGRPAAVLATVAHDGAVVGAVLGSPGRAVLVSGLAPVDAPEVVAALAHAGHRVAGCSGPVPEAEAFAAAHLARHGGRVRTRRALRLFALDTLVPPVGVPGRAHRAGPSDAPLLTRWRRGFVADAVPDEHPPTQDDLVDSLARPELAEFLWTVVGEPVAQARTQRPVAGMSRIGPVYTPPEHRGRGYAAAATAATARWALDVGAERVVLFTDLANPTTNRLYPRLGFRPVLDSVELEFTG